MPFSEYVELHCDWIRAGVKFKDDLIEQQKQAIAKLQAELKEAGK